MPDYYIHEADKWLVLPHERQGLTGEEIEHGKGRVADIIRTLREQGHGGN